MKYFLTCFTIAFLLTYSSCNIESEKFATSSDGVKISYEKAGKGNPTLLFIHGWTNNRSIWDEQISHFSKQYNVIAVDLAGCGKSGNNRDIWTMASFGDDVVSVIKHLDVDQVILVGFSMGGPVAIEAANKVPERIAGIVLVDNLQDIEIKYSPEAISYIDSMMMEMVTNPNREKLEGRFYKKNQDESYTRILAMLQGVSQIGWKESLNENFRWVNEDCIKSLKKVKAPIVAINSDAQPTNEEALKNIIPSFKVNVMSDVGHLVFWDDPDEFKTLLENSIQGFMIKN